MTLLAWAFDCKLTSNNSLFIHWKPNHMLILNTSAYVLDFTIILSLVITLFKHVPFWHHS